MKMVFMGTPDYAASALEALLKAGHEIVAVVTQPDKPKGRGREVQYCAVKECALKHDLKVFQPIKIKDKEAMEVLQQYEADVFVVAAFGQLLSKEVLEMPKYGCINIHASLLPKYRGAAPINWAIIDGESQTGITIMQMDEGIDTGDMLLKEAVSIEEFDTFQSLHDKLKECGARLIVTALQQLELGQLVPEKQDDSNACYAKKIQKSLGFIDWTQEAQVIQRKIRGLNPWPSAYTLFHQKTLKIWEAIVLKECSLGEPGTVHSVTKDAITVYTGNLLLVLKEVQLEGKKRMTVKEFLLGNQVQEGLRFGQE